MANFYLSSFSLMALIIMITAIVFILSIRRISDEADYKKWILFYFYGLLIWHGMGFISGGLHSQWRENTYRYTNTFFNFGLCLTSYAFVQVAYLFPRAAFEKERKISSFIIGVICLLYLASIIWFHFIKDQTGANSFTYGSFVNPRAGLLGFVISLFTIVVLIRKSIYLQKKGSKDKVPVRLLALCAIITLGLSALFIYPGSSVSFVLPTYIFGLWILIQAQLLIFIIYSAFPVRFESKLIGFSFASIMAILTILNMVILPFTTNSDDPSNLAQRMHDQPTLLKLSFIVVGAALFIVLIYPYILRVSLIKPLQNLMDGIKRADQGDLDIQVPHGMLDEIGVVTNNFNQMVKSLKISQEELKVYANTLQQQVEDRTSALRKSIEDLKAAQNQLIQSEKMASLGELTAGIAHEIQNPLNFVNNFSEVNKELVDELQHELKAGRIDDAMEIANDIKANEEKIHHHGKRAGAIVKGMLQHSRTSSGKKEPTDLNALCDEYLRLAYHGMKAKDKSFNATFIGTFDPDLPKLNVIPQEFGRVLVNLISNAFYAVAEKSKSAGPSYQPAVTVSSKRKDTTIEISVADNGNGIPDAIREKIFQPFFTTKPTGEGTGLGLSLSFDIVKAHEGQLSMESKQGEGTIFLIQLPMN
jgi:signal transduction histidine kinase